MFSQQDHTSSERCIASPKIFPAISQLMKCFLFTAFPRQPKHLLVPQTRRILFLLGKSQQMVRLRKQRKIPGEASGFWLPYWNATNTDTTEALMKSPLSYQARRELVERMAPQYRAASRSQKMLLLDTFVALTGYVRKYAMWLLNHPIESRPRSPHGHPVHYGSEVQQALYLAWRTANQICAKRLIPFLPTLVETLERHGHLHLAEEHRNQLLKVTLCPASGRALRRAIVLLLRWVCASLSF
jgi:hypothetical protein